MTSRPLRLICLLGLVLSLSGCGGNNTDKAEANVSKAHSGLINLTNSSQSEQVPLWSPDGKRIAFISLRDRNYNIYVMNADGSRPTRLTYSSLHPAWSPDSKQIAFTADDDGNSEIYLFNANGKVAPLMFWQH